MTIAIYLGWIRHKASGGVESYTRNLLDGLLATSKDDVFYLICSKDNYDSFAHYRSERVLLIDTGVVTYDVYKSIIFENFTLDKIVSELKADFCFVPCYRMPFIRKRNKYVVTIHDLQAFHFPQNFSFSRRLFLQLGVKNAVSAATKIVAISEYVKKDICKKIRCEENKIQTIYNPILPSLEFFDFASVASRYGDDLEANNYFYTISSLAKNKNLMTLLRLMKLVKERAIKGLPSKLVITGIGFNKKDADNIDKASLIQFIEENHFENNIIFTGFISNEERNTLIKNSHSFLFPSIFEGFGMPVVEAMIIGAKVITTTCTSILEVSRGQAIYVADPFDEKEWLDKIMETNAVQPTQYTFPEYDKEYVARRYLDLFRNI